MSLDIWQLIFFSALDTLYMVGVAGLIATAFGLPLGVFLATSGRGELFAAPWLNQALGFIVNATRSTPFIILVVAIIAFTRLIAGTSIGSSAAIVPLTIAATPFIGRLVEAAIREVDQGLIEMANAIGATPLQIVVKVLLPEALPAITLALTLAVVSLLGYSAMVGAVGGGNGRRPAKSPLPRSETFGAAGGRLLARRGAIDSARLRSYRTISPRLRRTRGSYGLQSANGCRFPAGVEAVLPQRPSVWPLKNRASTSRRCH
jgi:D-methionine transport system permease protein